jgi:hypothetical protein
MTNVVTDLIARIEDRRTETKNPCKHYSTEAKAESVAKNLSKEFATHFAIDKTQQPCRYVVAFDQAWGRWVVGFDLTELMGRTTSTGGYVGLAAQAGFFSY